MAGELRALTLLVCLASKVTRWRILSEKGKMIPVMEQKRYSSFYSFHWTSFVRSPFLFSFSVSPLSEFNNERVAFLPRGDILDVFSLPVKFKLESFSGFSHKKLSLCPSVPLSLSLFLLLLSLFRKLKEIRCETLEESRSRQTSTCSRELLFLIKIKNRKSSCHRCQVKLLF